jgi:hypothetical protein
VLIVTADDDTILPKMFLSQLVKYYIAFDENSIVAYRGRQIGFCNKFPHKMLTYGKMWSMCKWNTNEMLVLPTGTGGILYHPKFLHIAVFDEQFRFLTKTADDITFRLASFVNNVPIAIACLDHYSADSHHPKSHVKCDDRKIPNYNKNERLKQFILNFKPYAADVIDKRVRIGPTENKGLYNTVNSLHTNNVNAWHDGSNYIATKYDIKFEKFISTHIKRERPARCFSSYSDFTQCLVC